MIPFILTIVIAAPFVAAQAAAYRESDAAFCRRVQADFQLAQAEAADALESAKSCVSKLTPETSRLSLGVARCDLEARSALRAVDMLATAADTAERACRRR